MSTSDLHPEFDDELLSAYLDNELAPDERARVEKWLAEDPAARQLLDQLRSVSSAVHNLPREAVGTDLRDAILQRAERAMLTSKAAAPVTGGNGAPSAASLRDALGGYSIGRTRRGWIWAGAAIAAGLLVAAFQWAPERNNTSVEVAMNSPAAMKAPADVELQMRDESSPDYVSSKKSKLADEAPVVAAKMPEPPSSRLGGGGVGGGGGGGGVGGEVAKGGAIAASDRAALSQTEAVDAFAIAPSKSASQDSDATARAPERELAVAPVEKLEPSATAGVPISAPAPAAQSVLRDDLAANVSQKQSTADNTLKDASATNDLLVVHLTCSPEALRTDAFNDTLKQNGIELENTERETLIDKSALAIQSPDVQGKPSVETVRAKVADGSGIASSEEPEVVVVEAPPLQIFKCLDAIDKDKQNYLGVAVDARLVGANTNVAEEARRRGRGSVPQQSRVELTPENVVNVQTSRGQVEFNRNLDNVGMYAKGQLQANQQQSNPAPYFANQSRARYVQPQEVLGRASNDKKLNELPKSAAVSDTTATAGRDPQLGYMFRRDEQKLEANKLDANGNLQVLFMLWPGDQPPSSPAVNDKVSK